MTRTLTGAMAEALAEAPCLLLMLDYDGTLSPIVRRPSEAAPLPGALDLLERLSHLPGTMVAVISGRALSDLSGRVPCPQIVLFGNHGLECRGLPLAAPAGYDRLIERATSLAAQLTGRLRSIPEVLVENKGPVVSVHYRQAPSERWREIENIVLEVAGEADDFRLVRGKKVVELRPDLPIDKGAAVRTLLAEASARCGGEALAMYAGDDTTDEDAFAALEDGVTILIADEPRPTRAGHRLEGPHELMALLVEVERRRRGRSPGGHR